MGVFHLYFLLFCADSKNISSVIDVEAFCFKMKNKFTNFNFPMKCITSNLPVSHSAISLWQNAYMMRNLPYPDSIGSLSFLLI